jgi:Periplasmic binding protein
VLRLPQQVRLWLGTATLALTLASGVGLIASVPGLAATQDTRDIALDRQAYVPDAGPDAYQANSASGGGCSTPPCPDPANLHVGAAPNQSTYHSLIHIELSAIPAGDTVSSLVVTLVVSTDSQTNNSSVNEENVNPAGWILDAYPLSTELPAGFPGCTASTGCSAPTPDTSAPPVVGKAVTDGSGAITAFTFDVAPMLTYWQSKGANTGLAIMPAQGATTSPWVVAFSRNYSLAGATVQSPSGSVTVIPPAPPAGGSSTTTGGVSPALPPAPVAVAPVTVPTAAAASAAAAPSAAATTAPAPAKPPATTPAVIVEQPASGQVPVWLLVFGISLAFSVALLAQPAVQAFSSAAGLRAGSLAQLKLHPRAVAVAGTLLLWSSGWGVYNHATASPATTAASANGGNPAVAGIPSYAPATATPAPGATATAAAGTTNTGSGGNGSAGTAAGASGSSGGGAPVGAAAFAGNAPVAPRANLFSPADDTTGITNTTIQMCAHAALTFGPAFNIGASDLNVFWQMVNDPNADPYPHTAGQGGVYNRKIVQPGGADGIAVQDDGYQPAKAVQAAENCQSQSGGNFFLLSGIGFDQIPNVRAYAEQQHVLYIHHIATAARGLQYSFTMLPTLEQVGTQFGQYYLSHLNGKKIGIIERQSSNWSPGITTFTQALAAAGEKANIVKDDPVSNNQGDYTKQILDMKAAGADVVFIWENALAADQIIQQSSNQSYTPKWLLFPFNLTLYTLNQSQVDTSGMQGIVPWPAYTSSSARCTSGGSGITRNDADYGQYMQEIKTFEAAYAKYDPNANLCGDGGDLLFGTWEAWRQVADLLVKCGVNCSRNAIAGLMLDGYTSTVGANCEVSFAGGDHHHGGGPEDLYAVKPENGGPGWINNGYCETTIQ